MKLQELLAQFLDLQHERAAYANIRQYISTHLANDLGAPQRDMPFEDGLQTTVRESVLQKVLDEVDEKIIALSLEIKKHGNMSVPQVEGPKRKVKKLAAPRRKATVTK